MKKTINLMCVRTMIYVVYKKYYLYNENIKFSLALLQNCLSIKMLYNNVFFNSNKEMLYNIFFNSHKKMLLIKFYLNMGRSNVF